MPALAYHFMIRPWELDQLAVEDFHRLCAEVDALNKQAADTGDAGTRGR